ncbi:MULTISPECIES: membrane-bound PQQ-dependent dehydrogenase, glucose/quinate/shikimate family [Comamonas]|uniref:membrane-bound PQQ-dependent dehydrogenase, glucose/quinate/shikimate family n=1 Tax=Comamonas TaxID=283 RepID=UPI00050FB780|nr:MULTISPECIES: membrane-bound PQQ-dependent dehydrogenase, glucose/quinate/shikimate family [Comamonas]KGG83447.1 quinate dehydrogenase [Comamonas thiooxydans]KGG96144.1 quinate dehydrogenase [Comamonas thiooxydans]KGH02578.1 quinate dehydrogenase [Comamonas thiooxydans]KGH07609.1 quinate dehydrogenase [Comamonas thiooxydans]TZG09450.1 membrane-bound PQQ-dependent dehydrogenase, glucose/quinate/shikimate family [Comamonas thiooxydans]
MAPSSNDGRWYWLAVALLMLLMGLYLTIGGGILLGKGGSWYFVLMGLAMLASATLLLARRRAGAHLYALAFVLSMVWAWWDAGWEFWPLVSRLMVFAVLGLLVALGYAQLEAGKLVMNDYGRLGAAVSVVVLGLGIVATAVSAFSPKGVIAPEVTEVPSVGSMEIKASDWTDWGQGPAGQRFAAVEQISRDNVDKLAVAWTARTGDVPQSTGSGAEDQNTPQQIGDRLYVCTAYGKVLALDVDTGEEKWKFDPEARSPNWQRCRGLGYFDGNEAAIKASGALGKPGDAAPGCRRRLFLPTIDARLIALDPDSGKPCTDFGKDGVVDLTEGMGEVKQGWYQQTSAPLVAENLVIVGGRVADNFSIDEPSGVVRAFDVHSGRLVWAWDPGNADITGQLPQGQTYTRNSPNVWGGMSYDARLGLAYLGTGNATPDFYAAQRTPEMEKNSSAIVAMDIRTGKPRWLYQTVHHDLWDFDIPSQPALVDVSNAQGGVDPALLQVTKQGMIFMLNRESGEPLAEVQELPVPQGHVPGERYAPTQPHSTGMPNIGNQTLKESDMWGATPFDQLLCRIAFKDMDHQGVFTPPGMGPTLQFPGSLGGMNWGSVSIDPISQTMFVNDMRLGLANYMIARADMKPGASGIEMGAVPQEGTPFGAMRQRFLSPLGIPCQKPPFGTMTAVDLKSRQIKWQVPVGTVRDTGPLGIPMWLTIPIGMPTLGPSMVTKSGLVFFAGTQDFYLRAFDSANGKEIWRSRLPVGSQGGPMSYVSPRTGRQYVVITAGGARQSPKRGDYVIAYALPQ